MTDVTGLIPVMSSADSHDSTSRLLPAEVEVGMGRPIRRSFGRQPYKSPSVYEKVGIKSTGTLTHSKASFGPALELSRYRPRVLRQHWYCGLRI
uniref:Uncharacterized protein n=1 Tax=Oryza sativa subsp. japonica TaxID=39947 RepID=Q8W2Z5_ORYSJ|nr:hypothetical protein [Oryza sativa Japonica Group]